MIAISFADLQKITFSQKFGGYGLEIEPSTPISILNFSWVLQSYLVSHALQILVNDRSFMGNQMIFQSVILSVTGKLTFEKNCPGGTQVCALPLV